MSIQIVVPIYNAYAAVKACLAALQRYSYAADVLLINDASTDDRISTLLEQQPKAWQIIHNPKNLGFVQTANKGLQAHAGHSILLNSDTLVSARWLMGFEQAIEKIQDLGTATPWSNNAEICSLPNTLVANEIPKNIDEVGLQLYKNHVPTWPEIPTAVGFCMLITAQAKRHVGYFDEITFGKGYGEENDYSLRVADNGLKNILIDNSYVAHVGNQSFKEIMLQPNAQTMQRLLTKHPDYLQLIEKYIKSNPLSSLRQSIIAKIDAF